MGEAAAGAFRPTRGQLPRAAPRPHVRKPRGPLLAQGHRFLFNLGMRVLTKLAGSMLLGTCAILGVAAVDNHEREVAFFEADTRRDHLMVGNALAEVIQKIWREQGKDAALRVPHHVESGDRDLSVFALDPANSASLATLAPRDRERLAAGEAVDHRERGVHRTYLPVAGPDGAALVLGVEESLAEEAVFSSASTWRNVVVAAGIVVLCGGLALAGGFHWVGRPIRRLGASARRIGGGDLDAPVVASGNDEFTTLARELDAMRLAMLAARTTVAQRTEERIAALEQLRHADRLATVGRLAAGVAHELGTPLNVVGETAKMIGRAEIAGADLPEAVDMIVAQTTRMTTIIRQLLDFARPRQPVRVTTDVGDLCRRTLQFLEQFASKRGVATRLVHVDPSPLADVDAIQIEQVVTNLVVNAVQATPDGGRVELAVRAVTATPRADCGATGTRWLRLDVRDTGCGIDPEHIERLFEPFFTTKGVGEGTGLGLSVSRGIVRENGGWIEVSSTKGDGACFSVFLPASQPENSVGR